ncbi:aspartate kinase [Clostridium cylindrosporum]|uniref:Aspartokinase n=1 Tax=Clostridium cylindrosporum DSM 605 TaxID=1121307 RepID=A0A0J8DBE2_CLOCY|nr:aspartate kinase [Clostridium cylindrosporum]KMT23152.1 aspartokinase 3 [Clostridium cylindrosporum DSM 605]
MAVKVAKFGGSSLANSEQFKKVYNIIQMDKDRKYVVPSAFGKRSSDDTKITDLLLLCGTHAENNKPFDDVFSIIENRCLDIVKELDLDLDMTPYLKEIKDTISTNASKEYAASRGEYMSGIILSKLLGYEFIDAAEVIRFEKSGQLDYETTIALLKKKLSKAPNAVIPGFYGATGSGRIVTFSRGGSDVTGALVAQAVDASVYENFTDVCGLLMTNPCIVENPKPIEKVTYRELRELAYMGATVIHEDAIRPVRDAAIPLNIRNTNDPSHPGTMIVGDVEQNASAGTITGIAGKKDFTVIAIEQSYMNSHVGYAQKILSILADFDVSFECMPSGIDNISLVIESSYLEGKLYDIVEQIRLQCNPDSVEVYPNMALIATVGRGMIYMPGMSSKLFSSLYNSGVNIRMINQGSSEINIIVGVENDDFEKAIRSIYDAFVE